MSKYYVIHSNDPYLLARFCTELQMEGWYYPKYWEDHHPFHNSYGLKYHWLALIVDKKEIKSHNHPCAVGNRTRFTITESNYLEVLEEVLKNKTN